jgi:dephospho-CoA kinase
MAAKIFSDEKLLKKVNDIIHPAVNRFIFDEIENEKKRDELDYLFIEAALLIENGYDKIVDELWYIYASEDTRRERLKESRGYSDEKVSDIFANQQSENVFRAKCKLVINNDGDFEECKKAISSAIANIRH